MGKRKHNKKNKNRSHKININSTTETLRKSESKHSIWDTFIKPLTASSKSTSIRFKNQSLNMLRGKLLADTSNEYFAALLAKTEELDNLRVINVIDVAYPKPEAYKGQGGASLRIDFDSFMKDVLIDVDERIDVDTVIDVHTHPFTENNAWFSGVDDQDEANFALYLKKYGIKYASIVFTQKRYKARYWEVDDKGHPWYSDAYIKTQKATEQIKSPDDECKTDNNGDNSEMFDRSIRALGLDNMRKITDAQTISIVGVGGLGSIVAEHLIHMGFSKINLIDFDKLEISNMNRIVGATYSDAENELLKVDAVRNHLLSINPNAEVKALPLDVFDSKFDEVVAGSDWVILATDNHASRFHVQELCFKYFVPFIASGVNITVDDGQISDMSGETILVRMGDKVCLNCLGRVNFNEIAKEKHPDPVVRDGLVRKGYVQGKDVHEPAVKTLNTYLATNVVDTLVNQYTERRRDQIITVYEDNEAPCFYEDKSSLRIRRGHCSFCDI